MISFRTFVVAAGAEMFLTSANTAPASAILHRHRKAQLLCRLHQQSFETRAGLAGALLQLGAQIRPDRHGTDRYGLYKISAAVW